MAKIFVFCFLVLSPFLTFAQVSIKGKITNAQTSTPVVNAHILAEGVSLGVTSDSMGNFEIKVKELPVVLIISHISYYNKEQKVSNMDFQKILLEVNTNLLDTFSVTADYKKNISGGKSFLIIDYEFANDNILQLCRNLSSGKYLLKLTSLNGELISELSLNQKPDKLYKDCEGFVYLVLKDIVQEINTKENTIALGGSYTEKEFVAISRCIIEFQNKYYFNAFSGNKQKIAYFYINKDASSKPAKIKEIEDEKKQRMCQDELRFRTMPGSEFNEFDEIFANKFIYTPIYAPLLKVKEGYCIFDFVNGRIEHFSKANEIAQTVPITFHKEKGWKKELLYDQKTDNVYQLFELNGIVIIKEIDVKTGNLVSQIELKGFSFAENIRVYGGYIYFIGRNPDNNQLKQIFRNKFN
ncbi:MAG: carboxypeptidase-like regulatory domain-containing protein [Bacteroidota bacterium]|nr:carboxypeptidase-like regulatory domain-containing protein [Bacteroidota bacterium]